jgi:uncharacterized phiE125 gp8 family phage protein
MAMAELPFTLTLNTAPEVEPVTVQEAKDHMKVPGTDDDALVGTVVLAARQYVESVTGRSLISQTWDLFLETFPDEIRLPKGPVQSITSITYVDENGSTQTLGASTYTLDSTTDPPRIVLAYGESWPDVRAQAQAICVTYVAGYGDDPADVPEPVRLSVMMMAATLYEHREMIASGGGISRIPFSVDHLLMPYRAWR